MIVAAGAPDRDAHERFGDDVDLFVHNVHLILPLIQLVQVDGAHGEESCGDSILVTLLGRIRGQQIARNLLDDELIVGQVPVEGVNHPIAIAPGEGKGGVARPSGGFAVAGNIEPMASPAFAE